jgi:hypothetical protein
MIKSCSAQRGAIQDSSKENGVVPKCLGRKIKIKKQIKETLHFFLSNFQSAKIMSEVVK